MNINDFKKPESEEDFLRLAASKIQDASHAYYNAGVLAEFDNPKKALEYFKKSLELNFNNMVASEGIKRVSAHLDFLKKT